MSAELHDRPNDVGTSTTNLRGIWHKSSRFPIKCLMGMSRVAPELDEDVGDVITIILGVPLAWGRSLEIIAQHLKRRSILFRGSSLDRVDRRSFPNRTGLQRPLRPANREMDQWYSVARITFDQGIDVMQSMW